MSRGILTLILLILLTKSIFGIENVKFQINSPNKIPSNSDWQYFLSLKQPEREAIFKKVQEDEKSLKKWSWPWRQGWIQICEEDPENWCRDLTLWGLKDNAAIVRSRAAQSLGRFFKGSNNNEIIKALEIEYTDSKNYRNKKPLFVCNDIIFAILKIGGKDTKQLAFKLAKNHAATKNYWQKLYH